MARMRSPNFPAMSLEDSIKAATAIFDKNRLALIMREDAAKDIGYSGLTGRSMQVLGALNQYDLLENAAKGKCRVTQTLSDILHGVPDSVKHAALRKAGHSPPLFKAIFDRFEGEIPGENAVRSFLIQSGFTNEGADKALKNFLSTNRYLEMNGVFESYGDSEEIEEESPSPQSCGQENSPMHRTTERPTPPPVMRPAEGPLHFTYSMDDVITVTGSSRSAREVQIFIDKLSKAMAMLPPHIEKADDSEANGQ